MIRYTNLNALKSLLSVLFLAVSAAVALQTQPAPAPRAAAETVPSDLCRCCKINPDLPGSAGCTPPAGPESHPLGLSLLEPSQARQEPALQRVAVSTLVRQALADQRVMLRARLADLQRWQGQDRAAFALWFGSASEDARDLIARRVMRVLELNKNYSVENFRRASPPRPNVYAYVYANQPSKVYLDMLFVGQRPAGENSRAGTITHEMSHFTIVGGTKDHAYGQANCKALARRSAALALNNADNFEYWAEGAR